MKIPLDNGGELELQSVSQVAIDEIITDLGGYDLQSKLSAMNDEQLRAHFASYSEEEMAAYLAAQHRQMLYCFGWGVKDDLPDGAIEALRVLGKDSKYPQVQKANWLIYVADLTRPDKSRIIGGVMALTYAVEYNRMINNAS